MFGKTPITTLQEYCAKKNVVLPVYKFWDAEGGAKSFHCSVEALNEMAEGLGRSKKEAKHDAAANMLKKLKTSHPDIDDIPQAPHETVPTSDAIADLRDLCIQQDHPLPTFEMIQQAGPPEAPEFTFKCQVASIIRYATFSTKKGAKQLAAQLLIDIIQDIPPEQNELQIARFDDCCEVQNEETRKKIKTYREYVDSDIKEEPGTLLKDRHNYFKKMIPTLRDKARKILDDSSSFLTEKERVHEILTQLEIQYKTQEIPSATGGKLVFLELICDMDIVFADQPDNIYSVVLDYFRDML